MAILQLPVGPALFSSYKGCQLTSSQFNFLFLKKRLWFLSESLQRRFIAFQSVTCRWMLAVPGLRLASRGLVSSLRWSRSSRSECHEVDHYPDMYVLLPLLWLPTHSHSLPYISHSHIITIKRKQIIDGRLLFGLNVTDENFKSNHEK